MLNEVDTWLSVLGKDPEENTRTHISAFYSHQAMSAIKTGRLFLSLIPEPVTEKQLQWAFPTQSKDIVWI